MDLTNAPKGATHYHPGNEDWEPHFVKMTPAHPFGDVHTWVTGFRGGPSWNGLCSHAPVRDLTRIPSNIPEMARGDTWMFKRSGWKDYQEIKVTYVGESCIVVYKRHPSNNRWKEFAIQLNNSYGDLIFKTIAEYHQLEDNT
ncbi:MAG: hypothetical protein KUG81_01880 [Gammaproteobacteria bacterium]|nr:hypothetical protein [Gammaproteobacteria bacterium]